MSRILVEAKENTDPRHDTVLYDVAPNYTSKKTSILAFWAKRMPNGFRRYYRNGDTSHERIVAIKAFTSPETALKSHVEDCEARVARAKQELECAEDGLQDAMALAAAFAREQHEETQR